MCLCLTLTSHFLWQESRQAERTEKDMNSRLSDATEQRGRELFLDVKRCQTRRNEVPCHPNVMCCGPLVATEGNDTFIVEFSFSSKIF